jgi:hypothetical protein
MPDDVIQVGHYQVLIESSVQKFWPLNPDTLDFVAAADEAYVAPTSSARTDFNTFVFPPQFGVFDILIEFSKDKLKEEKVANSRIAQKLLTFLIGRPTRDNTMGKKDGDENMPLVMNDKRQSRICFAVYIPRDKDFFEGKLKLVVKREHSPHEVDFELPLKVQKYRQQEDRADKLFIFLVALPVGQLPHVNASALHKYCWFQMKVVEQCDQQQTVKGALVTAKVLREQNSFAEINRRTFLLSDDNGFVQRDKRNILGLPVEWPILFNVEVGGYVQRGHMCRFREADIKNNLAPIRAPDVPLMKTADVDLSPYSIMLDPGHAVVYNYDQRRSQEWFVVHRVAERIRDLLTQYKMPANQIFWTRTAGFALIEPTAAAIRSPAAPEVGSVEDLPNGLNNPNPRYVFDLPTRRIRFRNDNRPLKGLSDLLLTAHNENTYAPLAVADVDRRHLLDLNAQTIRAIEQRLNQHLAGHHQRVQPGSIRWDANNQDYVYTLERIPQHPNDPAVTVNDHVQLTVNSSDWFSTDDGMLRALARRSALWSLESEIGAGPAGFIPAARNAMRNAHAVDYMTDQIMHYIDPNSPAAWFQYGIKGWHPHPRVAYMNQTPCNLYLTLHENANGGGGGSKGGFVVLPHDGAVPAGQVRLAKTFVKYIDVFDQGVYADSGGMHRAFHGLYMLGNANNQLAQYAYLETEFMDATNPAHPAHFRYEEMTLDDFANTLSKQIVNGVIEWLLDPQDLDAVTFRNHVPLW